MSRNIKFVNHGYPKGEEIGVTEQSIQFIQKSDTCDIDRFQQVNFKTVGLGYDERDNTDSFIRVSIGDPYMIEKMDQNEEIQTDIAPFWSCQGPEELVELFNIFAERTGMTCRWKLEKYHINELNEKK